MKQDGKLGNMLSVIPLRVNYFLQKYQKYVWYQDNLYLADNMMVRLFQFGSTVRNKLKRANIIEEKQWKEMKK